MKRMAVLGLLALASGSAQAEHSVPGWRAGAAATFGAFAGDDLSAEELGKDFIDDNAIGYKIFAQYQLNDWLGLEGAYHLSGSFEDRSTNELLPGQLELTFDGFSAQGLLYVPTTIDDFDAYVKAGLYDFDTELAVDGTTNSNFLRAGPGGRCGFHLPPERTAGLPGRVRVLRRRGRRPVGREPRRGIFVRWQVAPGGRRNRTPAAASPVGQQRQLITRQVGCFQHS